MRRNTPKAAAVVGLVLVGVSGLLYLGLHVTTKWEQAQSPGQKNLGVAVLFLMFGIPALVCAGAAAISFVVSGIAFGYQRVCQRRPQ
jgi:hypothetical protein